MSRITNRNRMSTNPPRTGRDLGKFIDGYVEAALWSTNDESDEQGGEPLDANYSSDDIAPETYARMRKDCQDFWDDHSSEILSDSSKQIGDYGAPALAGHDFWLTRNRHGAGFDDGQWPKYGETLARAAHAYGEVYLLVGDDGEIHGHDERHRAVGERRGSRVRMPRMDGDYAVQQLYNDGSLVGGGHSEEWYDDEQEAITKAKRIARASWFEGDSTRVITRDGEFVWSSDGQMGEKRGVVHAPRVKDYEVIDRRDRRIGGPFKHRHEADAVAGPADVVRFLPAGRRASEAREILTRGDGTPIEKPRRSDFNSDIEYAQAFYRYKDEIAKAANSGFDSGLKRSRRAREVRSPAQLAKTKKVAAPKARRSAPKKKR